VTLYADASALVKLYVSEPNSDEARDLLRAEPRWASAVHAIVEVRRALKRVLAADDLRRARDEFADDWATMTVLEIDDAISRSAAEIAETTGAKTLDALHLAAAQRAGGAELTFVTFDHRQADVARSLGWTVVGVE
jgi:uncharacterized protein